MSSLLRPGMRGYLIPLVAGIALVVCAFLPWVRVSGVSLSGFPDVLALWIIGLGALASVLATLSIITRKNSRHPLLVIGLISLGIMFLSWRIMPRTAGDRALTLSQAFAIVENSPMQTETNAIAGSGIYLGLIASAAIVGFGLTIVVRRVSQPYAVPDPDDDV